MKRSVRIGVLVALTLLVGACGGSTAKDTSALNATAIPKSLVVTSPDFAEGGTIPRVNTCDGTGTPPTISWGAVPKDTKSVVVVVDDPDVAKGSFLHWLVIGLPPKAGQVPSHLPGVTQLDNAAGTIGWTPPCPPSGSTHHYRFSVYALNDYVCADNGDTSNGPDCSPPASSQALPQIQGTAIAKGVLVGTYRR